MSICIDVCSGYRKIHFPTVLAGTRPPPIQGIPMCLEDLMNRYVGGSSNCRLVCGWLHSVHVYVSNAQAISDMFQYFWTFSPFNFTSQHSSKRLCINVYWKLNSFSSWEYFYQSCVCLVWGINLSHWKKLVYFIFTSINVLTLTAQHNNTT